jgi:hypothetical protein
MKPDDLINSFLKAAKQLGVAALVTYGFSEDGKPVLRIASNSDEKGTAGILAWLNKTDERAVEAAAKAIGLADFQGNGAAHSPDDLWNAFHPETKEKYRIMAVVALEAVKALTTNKKVTTV